MKFRIVVLALIAGTAAAPSALSHLDSTAFSQSYRQSLFALLGANFGPMASMVKGEIPWDEARFIGWSGDLAEVAELDIMRGFPVGSGVGRTRAKPEIWDKLEDFAAKIANLRKETALMADVARNGDRRELIRQFQRTGGTCKACHDEYKSKDYL